VNKWIVPDWHDPTQYPCNCSLRQWAWEFLRRNPEYRDMWLEHIKPSYDPAAALAPRGVGLVKPAHCVPAAKQAELVHRFGLDSFPPSPDDDRPPLFTRSGLRYTTEREAGILLYPEQIAVVLDLKRPVERQVAAIRALIVKEKKRIGRKEHRNRLRQFASYLRVLDGGDAGATPAEIGMVLFGDKSHEERLIAVRDYRDAATRLRDTDYLFVAIS
jgi:hypothetical protein